MIIEVQLTQISRLTNTYLQPIDTGLIMDRRLDKISVPVRQAGWLPFINADLDKS